MIALDLIVPIKVSPKSAEALFRTMSEHAIITCSRPDAAAVRLRSPASREALAKAIAALRAYAEHGVADGARVTPIADEDDLRVPPSLTPWELRLNNELGLEPLFCASGEATVKDAENEEVCRCPSVAIATAIADALNEVSDRSEYQRGFLDGVKSRDEQRVMDMEALLQAHAEQLAEARREEREACAQIVESAKLASYCEDTRDVRDDLAAQIRSREGQRAPTEER